MTKFPSQFTPQDIGMLEAGKAAIYCWGKIEYLDIFGEERETEFNLMMGGDIGGFPDSLMLCSHGNRAT